MHRRPPLALLAACLALWAATAPARTLLSHPVHLGVAGLAEWAEFETPAPHGPQLELTFAAEPNRAEHTLLIRQRDVKATWNVLVNGKRLGALETLAQPLVLALRVPAGTLRAGENRLTIARSPSRLVDDVVVGEITLLPQARDALLGQSTLEVAVTEPGRDGPLPCRITITDTAGALAPLRAADGQRLAVRTGVVYTGDGRARLGLAPGDYVVHASRGFEYGVGTERVTLGAGATQRLALHISREVPTPGWIAADTHIHTLTHSRHGDATIDERMLTIAGEGIELAIATDHNHHADYREPAARTGMAEHFRPVVGNEVTTKAGHFNAFPVDPAGRVPDAQLTDWPALLQHIRSVTAARVITLNHPRDVHQNFMPFGPDNFDATTGALKPAPRLDFDAIEVVTSAAMQSDVMQLYRDWFALLNHGHRGAGIAASDTHHVSEFILGQARTYVAARDENLGRLDLEEVWESFRRGRLLVSLGLLTHVRVDERFGPGELVTPAAQHVRVDIEVLGPSWVDADRVELFANGIKVREAAIGPTRDIVKAKLTWTLPKPKHDVHLVAIATGPGVTGPFWEVPRPYQPTAKVFEPRVIGSTNPAWIDADGDRAFTPAREYAARLVARAAGDAGRLATWLTDYDEAVAVQARDLAK